MKPAQRVGWFIVGREGYGIRRATTSMALCLRSNNVEVSFFALREGSLAEELRQQGFSVTVAPSYEAAPLDARGVHFLRAVFARFAISLRVRPYLLSWIKEKRPNWLHLRTNELLPAAAFAAFTTGLPTFWHLPNTISQRLPFGLQALLYQTLCRLTGIQPLANSQHTAESLGSRLTKTRTLHLGINTQTFSRSADYKKPTRADLGWEQSAFVFSIIARISPDKAQDRLLLAFATVFSLEPRARLLLAGGGSNTEYLARVKSLASTLPAGVVNIVGPVSDPRSIYHTSDVVINSRTGAEPFGLTIIEAMLMQIPVLAYRCGGPAETIVDGETGWLIEDASIEGYASGMIRALSDQPHWAKMGVAARKRAERLFSIDTTVKNYLDIVNANV